MYDLEDQRFDDPTSPFLLNCLDAVFATVHSVRAVWHRRRWFAELIVGRLASSSEPVRILDVACGGSRYVRDVVATVEDASRLEVTLIDQDATAIAFAKSMLEQSDAKITPLCGRVRDLRTLIAECDRFDIVLSTGLFDYLDQAAATELLEVMVKSTAPDANVAVCNFAPDDRSRMVKTWISDWHLVYRNEADLGDCFPENTLPCFDRSPDGSLTYAIAQV